eukprot:6613821-Prymnesium_polylepis.2
MPKFEDRLSSRPSVLYWRGKVGDDDDPLSTLLDSAMKTLQTLSERGVLLPEGLPEAGFVPPMELPPEVPPKQLLNRLDELRVVESVPPPSGGKLSSGCPPDPEAFAKLSYVRNDASGLRWSSGTKGVADRMGMISCSQPSDYRKSCFKLQPLALGSLRVTAQNISTLLGQTLEDASVDKFVDLESKPLPASLGELPFDVSEHPDATSAMARQALERIRADTHTYAQIQSSTKKATIKGLEDPLELPLLAEAKAAAMRLAAGQRSLASLQTELTKLKLADERFVSLALDVIIQSSNEVAQQPLKVTRSTSQKQRMLERRGGAEAAVAAVQQEAPACALESTSDGDVARFLLLRHSGHETKIWFTYMIGCVLSSSAASDLSRLNPFLLERRWELLLNLLALMLLRANRVGQINRVLNDLADADSLIRRCMPGGPAPHVPHPADASALL